MSEQDSWWWRLVGFGFRLLYNEMAFTYDWVSYTVSLGAWRCWQRTALKHLPDVETGLILEIAHGTGNLQLDLHAAGYAPLGYDLSPAMGRIAQRKLVRSQHPAQLTRGLAQNLPFTSESIAAIVSTFPTNFIIQPETLHEANRVLKAGGCFVVVLNGVFTGDSPIQTFLEWLYRITGQRDEAQIQAEHYFEGYGFEVTMVEESCPRSQAQLVILTKQAPQ